MDIEELKRRLPVAYPYLLIDRVLELGEGRVVARKCVSVNEPYFQGHFRPPLPSVMPGTMILEGMAQTAGLLLGEGELAFLAGIEGARFQRPVVPGDVLVFEARTVRSKGPVLKAEVRATVEGDLVARATITLMRRTADVGQAD